LTAFYKASAMPVDELEPRIGNWFAIWAELGWLCTRPQARKGGGGDR
jgi:hypothetical protein